MEINQNRQLIINFANAANNEQHLHVIPRSSALTAITKSKYEKRETRKFKVNWPCLFVIGNGNHWDLCSPKYIPGTSRKKIEMLLRSRFMKIVVIGDVKKHFIKSISMNQAETQCLSCIIMIAKEVFLKKTQQSITSREFRFCLQQHCIITRLTWERNEFWWLSAGSRSLFEWYCSVFPKVPQRVYRVPAASLESPAECFRGRWNVFRRLRNCFIESPQRVSSGPLVAWVPSMPFVFP